MIRTTIRQAGTDVHISIPPDYVGKSLEVLLYATDEPINISSAEVSTMSKYKGMLTSEEARQLNEYVKKSRDEWERNT